MLDFSILLKTIKQYWAKDDSDAELFETLLDWVISSDKCFNEKGEVYSFDAGEISKILKGKRKLPKNLVRNANNIPLVMIQGYLKREVIKNILEDQKNELFLHLKKLIESDLTISLKKREDFSAMNDFIEFLAELLRFTVTRPNNISILGINSDINDTLKKEINNKNKENKKETTSLKEKELAPEEYIYTHLKNWDDWRVRNTMNGTYFYNRFHPDYVIKEKIKINKTMKCFYSHVMTDTEARPGKLLIKACGTVIEDYSIVLLDGYRFLTIQPQWDNINIWFGKKLVSYEYYFFIMGTKAYEATRFLYAQAYSDESDYDFRRFKEVIIFYLSISEYREFKEYVCKSGDLIEKYMEKVKSDFDYVACIDTEEKIKIKKSLCIGKALNIMLNEWRKNNIAQKYSIIVEKLKNLSYVNYYSEPIALEAIKLLSEDVDATIKFLKTECNAEHFSWMGGMFIEILEITQNRILLETLYELAEKYRNDIWDSRGIDILDEVRTAECRLEELEFLKNRK